MKEDWQENRSSSQAFSWPDRKTVMNSTGSELSRSFTFGSTMFSPDQTAHDISKNVLKR